MNTSIQQSTIDFLKKEESVRYKAYKDCCGKWTIGVGHLIMDQEKDLLMKTITEQQVNSLLEHDLVTCKNVIDNHVQVELTQNQFNALASFIFNEGQGAFLQSTLLKKINSKAPKEEIEFEFKRWDKAVVNGHLVEVEGLLNRRLQEAQLYFSEK
jgi:lysozyme